jgi:serine/threonine protein kinase
VRSLSDVARLTHHFHLLFSTKQVSLMRSIRHPNLLTFFGAGTDRENRAFLVTELMARGSLKRLLRDPEQVLDWVVRLQFAIDTAAGTACPR